LQRETLQLLKDPRLVVADTMNLWIQTESAELAKLLKLVHGLVLNDGEARLLTGQQNLLVAAKEVLKMGPRFVVIKKGEHGSLLVSGRGDVLYCRLIRLKK
jgi:cytidine kinase